MEPVTTTTESGRDARFEIRDGPLPEAMRVLLVDYPREGWTTHPNFRQPTANWLGAHEGFRRLSAFLREMAERYLDRAVSADAFAATLSYYGRAMVHSLHAHHGWENRSYFPELAAADPRFISGLATLERDHATLDRFVDEFDAATKSTLTELRQVGGERHDEAGRLHAVAASIEGLLLRHLADEEDLAVPILLHYKLR